MTEKTYKKQKQVLNQALYGKVQVGEENGNPIWGLANKKDCNEAIRGVFDTVWRECVNETAAAHAYKTMLMMGLSAEQKTAKANICNKLIEQKVEELINECKN